MEHFLAGCGSIAWGGVGCQSHTLFFNIQKITKEQK
jgi:hypothetical protein